MRCVVFLCTTLVCFVSCQQKSESRLHEPEAGTQYEGAVGFDITPMMASAGAQQWLATYAADGKTARFRIEFAPPKASGDKEFGFLFGNGGFLAEPGSDSSVLLQSLKKALEAKNLPTNVKRLSELSSSMPPSARGSLMPQGVDSTQSLSEIGRLRRSSSPRVKLRSF